MKIKLFVLLIVFLCHGAIAQQFPVTKILDNGDPENRINLVFLSDGYKANELDQYIEDVKKVMNDIFAQTPFKEYKSYFNVMAIRVPSNQSGASHSQSTTDADCGPVPKATVDNYFGSAFDTSGIHRLLFPKNLSAVVTVLAANFPLYDQAFILVNSPYYGGSGGSFATASTDPSSSEVSIHEIGHSFASLADEYWAGDGYAAERANLTKENDPAKVKWKKWLTVDGVGIYNHAENTAWYRPHQNCKMRFLNVPFCRVCRETFTERIHVFVKPLLGYTPSSSTVELEEGTLNFSLDILKPVPNTIRITWKKNETAIASSKNKEAMILQASALQEGDNVIEAQVMDTTQLSRSDSHLSSHVYTVTWTIRKNNVTDVEVTSAVSEYEIDIYPNPVAEWLNVSYSLPRTSQVTVRVIDSAGKIVRSFAHEQQLPGKHEYRINHPELNMDKPGIYYLTIDINGVQITERLISTK